MKLCEFVNVKQTKIRLTEDLISFGGKIYPKFGQAVILAGGAGCHAKGEKILKYNLTEANAEDVKVGDILMGDDNTPRTVLKLHRGRDTMVKLHLPGKPAAVFNKGHIFTAKLQDGSIVDSILPLISYQVTP